MALPNRDVDVEKDRLWERFEEIQGDVDMENMAHGEHRADYERVALARLVSEETARVREECWSDAKAREAFLMSVDADAGQVHVAREIAAAIRARGEPTAQQRCDEAQAAMDALAEPWEGKP